MRIIFLSGLYPPYTKGGAEISTHYIARGLVELGHNVTVIAEGIQRQEGHYDGVQVIRIPFPFTKKVLFEKKQSKFLAECLKKEIGDPSLYDVIHAQDFRMAMALSETGWSNIAVTARDYAQISGCTNDMLAGGGITPGCSDGVHLLSCHRVAEVHGVKKIGRAVAYKINHEYRRSAFENFSLHVFISHAQKKRILATRSLVEPFMPVIYNSLPPEYLSANIRVGHGSSFLYVGTTEEYKGVGVLLKAWETIAKEDENAHLTIVGNGADRPRYEEQLARLGLQYRVTFEGKVEYDRLEDIYDESDAVIAPHLWVEPFGRTVAEGMSRGKVVITSNCGGPTELVGANERGLLVERNSVPSLIDGMRAFLGMSQYDRRALGENAQRWVRENLSMEIIARQYEKAYTDWL